MTSPSESQGDSVPIDQCVHDHCVHNRRELEQLSRLVDRRNEQGKRLLHDVETLKKECESTRVREHNIIQELALTRGVLAIRGREEKKKLQQISSLI